MEKEYHGVENGKMNNFSEWGAESPHFSNCVKYFSEELYSKADISTTNEEIGEK